jgi:hypothetical protein
LEILNQGGLIKKLKNSLKQNSLWI